MAMAASTENAGPDSNKVNGRINKVALILPIFRRFVCTSQEKHCESSLGYFRGRCVCCPVARDAITTELLANLAIIARLELVPFVLVPVISTASIG